MARNCYSIFKSTYAQGIADGLSTTAATAAAQISMQDCLDQQSRQVPAAQPIVIIPGGRPTDERPATKSDNVNRAGNLGIKSK